MSFFRPLIFVFLLLVRPALALDDLLPPEHVFKPSAQALSLDKVEISWQIADGYSLYRNNMRFESKTAGLELGEAVFPEGELRHDEFLGDSVHFHHELKVTLPIINVQRLKSAQIAVRYQGCSDEKGICYPPQTAVLTVTLNALPEPASNPLADLVKKIPSLNLTGQDELLPPEQAFEFSAFVKTANTLYVNWEIAPNYYLYREKIKLELLNANGTQLGTYSVPNGIPKHDEAFGSVEIFYDALNFDVPLQRASNAAQTVILRASYQGCAERGVCYPPMNKEIELTLPVTQQVQALPNTPVQTEASKPLSEQDAIVRSLRQDSVLMTLLSFLGFGLLLSLTPCIFPMIPILSGIIIGHDHSVSTRRAFLLSLSYVLASALTYTLFGVLAALFGENLQSDLQQPWVISLFSLIFVVLSLSMFGFYELELPNTLKDRLNKSSFRYQNGSLWGAAIMGALSTLIVGPCVAAPLAGALIYIGQTGNTMLGGSALFMMGLGMGFPLLLLGASAGRLLPRAGSWMVATKAVFGVIMLAVAVWMLSRILPATLTLLLWAMLLIVPSIYLRALDALPTEPSGWQKLQKGIGVLMLAYGIVLLIGVGMGNGNPLQPLQGLHATSNTANATTEELHFERVNSLAALSARLTQAAEQHKVVMLDFYADWCISCKEMATYTFTDARVQHALSKVVLLQADVTANNDDDKALLAKFQLIGPPAILFFDDHQQEKTQQRVIGYQDAETFLQTLQHISP
jgi:thiol:disulfide interchange protein DsbD